MKIDGRPSGPRDMHRFGTLLFDLETDPQQEHPLHDPEIEARMIVLLVKLMKANDAPPEQFERLGLSPSTVYRRANLRAPSTPGVL